MKEIAVIANEKKYAKYLKENLDQYFEKYAVINYYSMEEIEILEYVKEKYIVISAFTIFQQVKKKTKKDSELIIVDITLNKKNIDLIKKLPRGTRALLVNIDYRSCMKVITMLYGAGFKDLELVPYYSDIENYDQSIKVAITPDEAHLVPKGISKVIDIGQRVIDVSCVIQIADKLNIQNVFNSQKAINAKNNIFFTNVGMEKVLGENESLTERINVLIKLMDQGIIITDITGKIYLTNDKAKSLLTSRTEIITGFNISEVLPEINVVESKISSASKTGELINIDGTNLIISVTQIISNNEIRGNIITLDNFVDVEKRQHKIRSKITGQGHEATYDFDNIIGVSKEIKETKEIAKRMAKSNSSILIYGESGTGKELFAQSIHNYSDRKKYHFVAVNCSALPDNLLESELYGYDEGAFSGAKKGGKIGLFELAHQGTLFLDEIGEMPISLQSKLLRVIEERKILKVGGKDLIDIDVRIIAATNRDLFEMIQEGRFRKDLYYRLNVLPIKVPSLTQRKEDIIILFDSFKKDISASFSLSNSAKDKIIKHRWEGNIRELKNTVEYLANLDKTEIDCHDIPFGEDENTSVFTTQLSDTEEHLINQFRLHEVKNLGLYKFVLTEIEDYNKNRMHIGRNKLTEIAKDRGIFITEQEIKNGLIKLNNYGFIISNKGRKGSLITELGAELNKKIKQ